MIENLDLLFKRMKASRPVLLLGAGFSYGATNANNTPLLLGKKLSQELHKYFFVEGELSTLDPTMLSEINDKEDDLKEICSYLRLCGKVLERNKFLTAAFKGCKPAPEGFHQKLVKYVLHMEAKALWKRWNITILRYRAPPEFSENGIQLQTVLRI